jgi:hypothetical protein
VNGTLLAFSDLSAANSRWSLSPFDAPIQEPSQSGPSLISLGCCRADLSMQDVPYTAFGYSFICQASSDSMSTVRCRPGTRSSFAVSSLCSSIKRFSHSFEEYPNLKSAINHHASAQDLERRVRRPSLDRRQKLRPLMNPASSPSTPLAKAKIFTTPHLPLRPPPKKQPRLPFAPSQRGKRPPTPTVATSSCALPISTNGASMS